MYSIFYIQLDSSENISMIFITIISINVMKTVNVNMFRGKQLLIPGLLLCVLMSAVSANETVDKTAILGSRVELPCSLNASNQNVTWELAIPVYVTIATCTANTAACLIKAVFGPTYEASRNETSSTLSILRASRGRLHFRCLLGGEVEQIYIVNVIEVPVISPPNCNIIPTTSNQGKNVTLRFSCESHVPSQHPYRQTMLGFSENIFTNGKSDLHVRHNIDMENFRGNLNVVCELRLSDVDISESCSFPHSTNVTNIPGVRDAIFHCHADSGVAVTWRFLDSEGREEDMTDRSWTRDGGRSLLIKNITKQDLDKVAECRTNGSVGFGVINEIEPSENDGYNGSTRTYGSHGDRLVYVILTFVFSGVLLLILFSVVLRCKTKNRQSLEWQIPEDMEEIPSPSTTYQEIDNPPNAGGGGGGGGGGGTRGGGGPGRRGNQWEVDEQGYGIPMTVPDKLKGGDGQAGSPGAWAGQTEQYMDMSGRHREKEREYEIMKSLTYENC